MTIPLISLIIPAHNEAAYLPRLLDSVDAARRAFTGHPTAIEIIVVDDGSTDDTAGIARRAGATVIPSTARCIAGARNAGARAARGALLAFIDADNQMHPQTFTEIVRQLDRPDVIGGATSVVPERWSLGIAVTVALFLLVVLPLRIDTGVVFCRRADFERIGGYDERLRFAEDVALHIALWRLGRKTRRHLVRATAARAIFSARKFDQFGDWHYLPIMFKAPWYLLNRRAGDRLAARYWYDSGR